MATLDVIRTLTLRAKAEGFAQAEGAVKNLGETVDTSARRQLSLERSLAAVERRFISSAKEAQDFEKVQRQLNMVASQFPQFQDRINTVLTAAATKLNAVQSISGAVTASFGKMNSQLVSMNANVLTTMTALNGLGTNFGALQNGSGAVTARLGSFNNQLAVTQNGVQMMTVQLGQLGNQFGALPAKIGGAGGGAAGGAALPAAANNMNNLGSSTKAARYELLNFSRQMADVGVGIASGQSAFTVLIQQGTQVVDIFASSALAGRNFGKELLALVTPMRLLAVGTAAAAAAGVLLFNSWKNVELQFLNTAERLNVTTKALHALDEATAIKGISTDELLQNMEQFADQVNLAKRGLGDLGELFRLNGIRSKGTVEDFAQLADLIKNAKIEERVNVLRSAGVNVTPAWIGFMRQGGDAIRQAVTEAEKFGSKTDDSMIKKAREFDEAWNKAWKNFSTGWRALFQEIIEGLDEWINKSSGLANLAREGLKRVGVSTGQGFTASTEQELIELGRRRLMQMPSEGGPAPGFGGLPPPPVPKITVTPPKPTITQEELRAMERALSLERQRVQALGELATETEKAKLKRDELNLSVLQGVKLSQDEINKLVTIAELQEKARKSAERVSTLGDSATQAEKYGAAVDGLNVKLKEGVITQSDFNRKLLELNPIFGSLATNFSEFMNTFIQGMLNGTSVTQSLGAALKSLGSSITSSAIKDLGNVLVKSLSGGGAGSSGIGGLLGGLGSAAGGFGGPLTGAAVGIGVSLLGNLFSKNNEAQKAQEDALRQQAEAAKAAAEALTASQLALQGLVDGLTALNDVSGEVSKTIASAQAQFKGVQEAAQKQIEQAQLAVNKGVDPTAAFASAGQAIADANAQLAIFTQRTLTEARVALQTTGQGALTEIAQQMETVADKAKDLSDALIKAGVAADEAAQIVASDLVQAMDGLRKSVETDLVSQINEATGKGFLNSITDLMAQVRDAQALGVSPGVVSDFLRTQAQDIVNSSQLIGKEFHSLIRQFPELAGVVKEFGKDMTSSSDDIKSAFQGIVDYLNNLFTGSDSPLSPSGRLLASQKAFQSQLALAQSGNIEAQKQITKFAEDYRQAARDFFGSGAGYQSVLNTITTTLMALPVMKSKSVDPVAEALRDVVKERGAGGTTIGGVTIGGATGMTGSLSVAKAANDDVVTELHRMGRMLSSLLSQMVALQTATNNKIDRNTHATREQTRELSREARFAGRKGKAA